MGNGRQNPDRSGTGRIIDVDVVHGTAGIPDASPDLGSGGGSGDAVCPVADPENADRLGWRNQLHDRLTHFYDRCLRAAVYGKKGL
jgi:hypothetical protein